MSSSAARIAKIISSEKFTKMIGELHDRYDRIIIDTPPVGVVSDVLNLLPLCDGVIFTVRFNAIQRSAIRSALRRITDAKVPVFGVVMNQMSREVARYYSNSEYSSNQKYYRTHETGEIEVQVGEKKSDEPKENLEK